MYQTPVNFKNTQNYGPYLPLIQTSRQVMRTTDITNLDELNMHFTSILNILRDGIETELIQVGLVTVIFSDGVSIDLCITDYYINLIMWHLYYAVNEPIDSTKLFYHENLTRKIAKEYIDKFLAKYRRIYDNIVLNNILDDCLFKIKYVDEFSYFLCNTFNLEDFIFLGKKNKEFYDAIHADMTGVPIDEVKRLGMEYNKKAIDIIKNSDHCLSDTFRAEDGIQPKQFKEFAINIGIEPDGQGSVFPVPVNNSYINGGPTDVIQSMIVSSTGRTAQIVSRQKVSTSGDFARLLGLNNMDTHLHPDPNYSCDTRNFEVVTITSPGILKRYENRYYRLYENGVEQLLTAKDTHLLGKTIYVRSPMTCASHARGEGICYRCYGDLAYTNRILNIGKFAAEQLSSQLTQMLLSAKHILEAAVRSLIWSESFDKFFEIEYNTIRVREDVDLKGYYLILDPEEINREDEYEDFEFNEYIYQICIQDPTGNIMEFKLNSSDDDTNDAIYISGYLNEVANRKTTKRLDDKYVIDLSELKEPIFSFVVYNDEITSTLNEIEKLINTKQAVAMHDRNSIVQKLMTLIDKSGLSLNAVHMELILSNQIRAGLSSDEILETVHWEDPNPSYVLLPLSRALSNNPSITISLHYRNLNKTLYNPLSYKKTKASSMDLVFMERPQDYISK